ncbi:siderophore ABC transporter substrate-binding protein [Vagococcus fessus]|uniref:Iron ABC transporter substrate-binding protein n=1 Tax=Vagococcus fessus TaxID=120370 RepID=A0A430A4P2_9ENTE|nr:siderophore ABC transporter substrate-binding protein [Vagococcus fessus]RSU01687.1 iron ABC transporter substrate-binding protein [Vagococcus fessus]
MRRTKFKVFGIALAGMLVMAGCSKSVDNKKDNAEGDKVSQVITVEDASGKVEVPKSPKKVVVFDMGSLDTIRELGKEDTVIGVPQKNLPKYLESFKEVESVGGLKEPDLEKINQLKPDLIVISGRQEDYKKDLEAIAPTVYLSVDSSKTWESTVSNINTLAKIFDEEKVAKEKIATIEDKIKTVKKEAQASGLKTLTTLVNEGQLSAYGEGSRFGIVHDTFGFPVADDKIEASTHGQSVSYEYVLEKNPDIIFVVDRTKAIGGDTSQNNVAKNELVAQTKAGQTNKVVSLTPDVWYLSGGGIKCTELMLEDVEKALN